MIKGLSITPPVLGRISIGKVVEKNGKRLPEKDDQFTITTQVQNQQGWVHHPLNEHLRSEGNHKLRAIPVKLLFNAPDLNFRVQYSCFDRSTGRPLCVGDGEACKRFVEGGIDDLPCPGTEHCDYGRLNGCKPYGRLYVQLDSTDDLGCFVFRTTGYNSIRTLTARLSYYQAVSGNRLSHLPLELKLRGKSTAQSFRQPVYYVDLCLPDGVSLPTAVQEAQENEKQALDAGVDLIALEHMARLGLANGPLEYAVDEGVEIQEEFYPEPEASSDKATSPATPESVVPLKDKLQQKAQALDQTLGQANLQ